MTSGTPGAALSDAERALHALLHDSHFATQNDLPRLIDDNAVVLGARGAVAYLIDLQQHVLIPFVAEDGYPPPGVEILAVDSTLAGRAFQHSDVLSQASGDEAARVWLPLLNGTERLGVLAVTIDAAHLAAVQNGVFGVRLRRFTTLVAELIMTKTAYGDMIVRLRRRAPMGLAAELQWSLLPPLTFSCYDVTVAGALEPAYRVAGDTLDYAVDVGLARAAVFDGMGHGLRSGQLATIAVAAYRNARRSGLDLLATATTVHEALMESFGGGMFSTGVLTELNTVTGVLSWVNAGHPEPLLFRDGRLVKTLSCQPAPPLGLELPPDRPRTAFTVCQEQLEPGDRVLLYTDGVTEARAQDGSSSVSSASWTCSPATSPPSCRPRRRCAG